MRRADILLSVVVSGLVLVAGVIAGLITFGVCNENAESAVCELADTGTINVLIGVIPALIVVGVGLVFGRAVLIVTAIGFILLQAVIAVGVVIAGP